MRAIWEGNRLAIATAGAGSRCRQWPEQSHFDGADVDGCTGTMSGGPNTIMFNADSTYATSVQLPALQGADGPLTIDGSGQAWCCRAWTTRSGFGAKQEQL